MIINDGVGECSNGSTRVYKRQYLYCHHWNSSINHQSIKDLFKLEKFNANQMKPRPIMFKLIKSTKVTNTLSKVNQLNSPYFIKPDRLLDERRKEKCLVEVRWSLIQSGIKQMHQKKKLKINKYIYIYIEFVCNKLGTVDFSNSFQYW